MTGRQTLYTGVSRAAWGYFFLYFDINLGSLNLLPDFAAYLLFLSAIRLLKGERRDLGLLRPLGLLLALWYIGGWLASWAGASLDGRFVPLDLIISAASLYFHFQLVTDFAALAAKYQPEGETLDRRLLKWRTVQTVLMTAMTLLTYLAEWFGDHEVWGYVMAVMAVVYLIAGLCLMLALFALRKLFRESAESPEAA